MNLNGINISSQGVQGATGMTGPSGAQQNAIFSGIHNALPYKSGDVISYQILATNFATGNIPADRLYAIPFIPVKDTRYSNLSIAVNSTTGTGFGRILVYDDLNDRPNSKLYESTDLDLSTAGIKIVNTSGTFLAGVTYWLCWYNSSNTAQVVINNTTTPQACLNVDYNSTLDTQLGYYMDVVFRGAPNRFSDSPILFNGSSPNFATIIYITLV